MPAGDTAGTRLQNGKIHAGKGKKRRITKKANYTMDDIVEPKDRHKIGYLEIRKGKIKTEESCVAFVSWDACMNCGEDCPIQGSCSQSDFMGKCGLQKNYLNEVYKALVADLKSDLTHQKVLIIGLKILPLYTQLFKFKLLEFSLNQNITVFSKSGVKIHPVYKEMRETIKLLVPLLRIVEVGYAQPKVDPKEPKSVGEFEADFSSGDPNYYEGLSK